MTGRSVIVIGGGLAGLATGVYARLNGYPVRVFERHAIPGGVCTSWTRKGFQIDGCIHWLMGCTPGSEMRRIYQEVGAWDDARVAPITHFLRHVDEGSGAQLDLTSDLGRLQADLEGLSPTDRPAIAAMMKAIRALRGFPMPVARPTDLLGPLEGARLLWSMRRALPVFGRYKMSCADFVQRFRSPLLRRFLEFVPEMPASFFFVLLACLADGDLMAYRGGSRFFARAVEERLRALGGEITYRAAVERVLVEGGRAVGVRLEDGSEHRADVVVSAADAHATLFDLLGGRFLTPTWKAAFERWPLFRPIALVSFGVTDAFAEAPQSFQAWLERPITVGPGAIRTLHVRLFSHDPAMAPPGETVVQVTVETDWDSWDGLARGPRDAYDAAKEGLAAEVLGRLERHLPGIHGKVAMTDVATPHTFWRFARVHRGAYEGWLPTVESRKVKLERTLPGLQGFHLVGQWVEPGGGVPPALYGPRHLLQRLCREDRRQFQAPCPP